MHFHTPAVLLLVIAVRMVVSKTLARGWAWWLGWAWWPCGPGSRSRPGPASLGHCCSAAGNCLVWLHCSVCFCPSMTSLHIVKVNPGPACARLRPGWNARPSWVPVLVPDRTLDSLRCPSMVEKQSWRNSVPIPTGLVPRARSRQASHHFSTSVSWQRCAQAILSVLLLLNTCSSGAHPTVGLFPTPSTPLWLASAQPLSTQDAKSAFWLLLG